MNLEEAKQYIIDAFQTSEKNIQYFKEVDPYNDNVVEGFLNKGQGDYYGSLLIFSVNDKQVNPQLILATPKIHYPFGKREDGTRVYHVKDYKKFIVYPKFDGTNIFTYTYSDHSGNIYITHKLRLTPFIRNSKWGEFKKLFDEASKQYPEFEKLVLNTTTFFNCGIAWELYGYKNQHLIKYNVPIDLRLLFARDQLTGDIVPPTVREKISNHSFETCFASGIHESDENLFKNEYEAYRQKAEEQNVKFEDGSISGTEGYVFYVCVGDKFVMYKCKPESIEKEHWCTASIPYADIITTVWNALESCDELTVDYIKELLMEEYSEKQIEKSIIKIHKAVDQVKDQINFDARVKQFTGHLVGDGDKRFILKHLSQFFSKDTMKQVYQSLIRQGIVNEDKHK